MYYIPSKRFTGQRDGYVFKSGEHGLGYYQTISYPNRHGEQWTCYEIEELNLSYRQWLLENAKKYGRTPYAIETKVNTF